LEARGNNLSKLIVLKDKGHGGQACREVLIGIFLKDNNLHMNAKGYEIWKEAITPKLK